MDLWVSPPWTCKLSKAHESHLVWLGLVACVQDLFLLSSVINLDCVRFQWDRQPILCIPGCPLESLCFHPIILKIVALHCSYVALNRFVYV